MKVGRGISLFSPRKTVVPIVISRALYLHILIRLTFTRAIVKCRLVVLGLESDSSPVFRDSDLDSDSKDGGSTTSLLGNRRP
jgi:hypothetical protein